MGLVSVDGGYCDWVDDGDCSVTCGDGSQNQTRICDCPAPLYGGNDCDGPSQQTLPCNDKPCPSEEQGH